MLSRVLYRNPLYCHFMAPIEPWECQHPFQALVIHSIRPVDHLYIYTLQNRKCLAKFELVSNSTNDVNKVREKMPQQHAHIPYKSWVLSDAHLSTCFRYNAQSQAIARDVALPCFQTVLLSKDDVIAMDA